MGLDHVSLSREEPDAGIPLVRVCGGRGGNRLAYPASRDPAKHALRADQDP